MSDLYLQGWLQADIATELNLSESTVSRDLKALQGQWLKSALIDFDEAKSRELAKIDRLEREYWRGWKRSCEDAETITKDGTPAAVEKVKRTAKGQAGDPRFLAGVQWCIDRRCKVLGIDAAAKFDFSSAGEKIEVTYINNWRGNATD